MHELSIAISLIDLAVEEAARQGDVRVAALHLRIGPLSGVVSDSLRFSFNLAAEGTPVEGARLESEELPVTVRCVTCPGEHVLAMPHRVRCPVCNEPADVVGGRELVLSAMEVVDAGTDC
jgi:hydrogenase nickel incorporation protein HypA/HybF